MSSMESLDKLQAELSGNVYGDAFHTLYKLSQDVNVEHAELMAQAMRYVRKEKVEPLEAENAKLRELASKLGILADSGLMALDDKEFASIIDNAKELGVDWWTSSSVCSASTSTSSSATSTATRLTT